MRVFYSPEYVASDFDIDTTRKAAWVAESLLSDPIPGVEMVRPTPLSREELLLAHSPEYVAAVETGEPRRLAETNYLPWNPRLWPSARSSNGGMRDAASAALSDGVSGSLSSGLHHARAAEGKGFCTFNGLAVAALAVIRENPGARVLVLDLDAHGGGGTHSVVGDVAGVTHLDVSTSSMDPPGHGGRHGHYLVEDPEEYLLTIRLVLASARREPFDLCLYNAGMDVYRFPVGIDEATIRERERTVFDWLGERGLPTAFCLAGGYVEETFPRELLVELHRATIAEAARISR